MNINKLLLRHDYSIPSFFAAVVAFMAVVDVRCAQSMPERSGNDEYTEGILELAHICTVRHGQPARMSSRP